MDNIIYAGCSHYEGCKVPVCIFGQYNNRVPFIKGHIFYSALDLAGSVLTRCEYDNTKTVSIEALEENVGSGCCNSIW
jgi:hypothetical protein